MTAPDVDEAETSAGLLALAVLAARRGKLGHARVYAIWAGGRAYLEELPRTVPLLPADLLVAAATMLAMGWRDGWDLEERRAVAALSPVPTSEPSGRLPYADN